MNRDLMLPRAVIFDCDGVLVDSWAGTMHFYNRVRSDLGLAPLTPEDQALAFTLPIGQALKQLYPAHRLQEVLDAATSIPEQEIAAWIEPMPGAVECLQELRGLGLRLGVNTNGGAETLRVLDAHGMLQLVHRVVTVEDVARPKPDPEGVALLLQGFGLAADQAVYVGDSRVDAATARAAGVRFWAFGAGGMGEDLLVPDFAFFMQWIRDP